MKKDIQIPEVTDLFMAVVKEFNETYRTDDWNVYIINNNNVDNSMQSSQTTAVSIPAPTRTNESTVRALQMSG